MQNITEVTFVALVFVINYIEACAIKMTKSLCTVGRKYAFVIRCRFDIFFV